MKTLFELAQCHAERDERQGNFKPPQYYLDVAACKCLEGYSDLAEAEDEELTRYDAYGNEIEPSVVWQAARYLRESADECARRLRKLADDLDSNAGERIANLPDTDSFDKLADGIEGRTIEQCEKLKWAAAMLERYFAKPCTA